MPEALVRCALRKYCHQMTLSDGRIKIFEVCAERIKTSQELVRAAARFCTELLECLPSLVNSQVSVEQFHQLRYNVAKVLRDMQEVERHPIMRIAFDAEKSLADEK